MTEPLHDLGHALNPLAIGQFGRAIMITGRPSMRAASILARAPSPPELRATIHAMPRVRIISSSPSNVNGPRDTITSAAKGSGASGGSTNRSV